MRITAFLITLPLVLSACFGSGARKGGTPEPENGIKPEKLSPAEWSALGRPSPSHQLLDLFVGTWNVTFSSKDDKGTVVDSKGISKTSWILGKRFLREDFEGEVFGDRFQGMGLMGYDNGARRFTSVWIDSQSTTMAVSYGKYFEEANRFEFEGEVYDPTLGAMKKVRSQLQMRSSNEYVFTMFNTGAGGRETEFLTISYRRRSS